MNHYSNLKNTLISLRYLVALLATVGLTEGALPVRTQAQASLTVEHVDLNMGYVPGATINTPGTWSMQARDDDNGIAYTPEDAILVVGTAAQATRTGVTAGSAYNFLGTPVGGNYWRLPQSQDFDLLYLGVAGYNTNATLFDAYDVSTESKGRTSGTTTWLKLRLLSVTGVDGGAAPGTFSAWQSSASGPNVFMSSFYDPLSTPNANGFNPTDGISSDDSLWIPAGGHVHYNWGFSAPGDYKVSFGVSGYRNDGNSGTLGPLDSSQTPFTFLFRVEGNLAVPEPAPIFFLTAGLPAFRFLGRRRPRFINAISPRS